MTIPNTLPLIHLRDRKLDALIAARAAEYRYRADPYAVESARWAAADALVCVRALNRALGYRVNAALR